MLAGCIQQSQHRFGYSLSFSPVLPASDDDVPCLVHFAQPACAVWLLAEEKVNHEARILTKTDFLTSSFCRSSVISKGFCVTCETRIQNL